MVVVVVGIQLPTCYTSYNYPTSMHIIPIYLPTTTSHGVYMFFTSCVTYSYAYMPCRLCHRGGTSLTSASYFFSEDDMDKLEEIYI